MRYNYFLLLYVLCFSMQAQISKLNEFSKGKFYSSDVIIDDNNNVKGYFLLFETDKVAKEKYELEYVVLDENLTKVTNGFITEMKYESLLINASSIDVGVSLSGKNKLLITFLDNFKNSDLIRPGINFMRYRILDLETNELGPPFIFNNDKLLVDPVFDRTTTNWRNNQSEFIRPYDKLGFVVNSIDYFKGRRVTERYLKCFDENLKEKWKFVYEVNPRNAIKTMGYLTSDEDVLVMLSQKARYREQRTLIEYQPEMSLMLIDSKEGTLRKEFIFPESSKISYSVKECKIRGDKLFVIGNYYTSDKYGILYNEKNLGLYSFVFDKSTGNLLSSDYLKWDSLKDKYEVDRKGYIKRGFLFTHKMILKEDGDILVVVEPFLKKPVTVTMLFFTLDSKLGIKDVFEVSKPRDESTGKSGILKKPGEDDYLYYQNLGNDEYLFFLNDNDKVFYTRRNTQTKYGIVSYSEGKFKRQTIDFKTENSSIRAYNSKKGYMMLIENFDEKEKPTEFRLEKIHY